MIEKVNPSHPDKVADRIAGALVDLAYKKVEDPRIAVEVMLGHGKCNIIMETSVYISREEVKTIVHRISPQPMDIHYMATKQDVHLATNQLAGVRCGDNGIFKGMPTTDEQKFISGLAHAIYEAFPTDGKYIVDEDKDRLIICQSNAAKKDLQALYPTAEINPLGDWTGGTEVDTGCTNRKLGSDMGDAVTGGGLHGKDLSKADVSVNIYAHLEAQRLGKPVMFSCAIGDKKINGKPYAEIVEIARQYIKSLGGFERLAEWGLF